MSQRGAAIAALITALDLRGYGVHFDISNTWKAVGDSRRSTDGCYVVNVKTADQPLDLGRLVFALTHPGSFRQLGFSAMLSMNGNANYVFPPQESQARAHYSAWDCAVPTGVGSIDEVLRALTAFLARIKADVTFQGAI
jgi:hypothetical protein